MSNGTEMVRADERGLAAGSRAEENFGGKAMVRAAETASTAVAEQARAQTNARYIVAERNPRDMDNMRVRLLADCKRPGFAAVARYSKPVGGKPITGPSIRFVEAAIRHMGNVLVETPTVFDDPQKRIVRVALTDLETNTTYQADVVIEKTVERRQLRDGQIPLGSRTNSYGSTVYLVAASDDDLLVKSAALVSKAIRTLGLRIVPGDIVEEAMERCAETTQTRDAADPDAARKAVADNFATLGVLPSEIKAYLGCDIGAASPAQLTELRAIFAAIRDGEAAWADVLASKAPERVDGETGEVKANPAADKVKALLAKKQAEAKEAKSRRTAKAAPPAAATSEHDREPGDD